MNWINQYIKSFRIIAANYRWFIAGFSAVSAIFIFCSVLNSLLPVLLRSAANTFESENNVQAEFLFYSGCYAALWTFSQVLSNIRGVFSAWILAKCDATIYEAIVSRIFRYPYRAQQKLDPGYVVADINRSSSSFSMVTVGIFWTIVPIIVEITIAISVLYTIMGAMYAALFFAVCIILVSISIYVAKSSSSIHRALFEADNNLSSYTIERLARVYDIKLNNTLMKEFQSSRTFFDNYVNTIRKANLAMGVKIASQGLAIGTALAFFIMLSGLNYDSTFTAGDFVMVVGYITMFTLQLHMLAGTLINLQAHLVSLNDGIKYIEESVIKPIHPQEHSEIEGFTLEGVSLKKDNKPILNQINCQFKTGMNIISGCSGAGKTTLINVLLGFEHEYTGAAYYKGLSITEALSDHILSEVAVAPQKPILIPGTFRDNLIYGAETVSPQRLRQVVELLRLTPSGSDIDTFLSSPIDISGSGLSGGERQRIAIGRAILREKRTIILDEPTSALDEKSSQTIIDWLVLNIPCLIVVTHDENLKKKYGIALELSKEPIEPEECI
ncbi:MULTISPECIES: ABC transporter ATP-binding protein [unclassified Pseudomonas]|uniref:ATP-binding cassette domain-containing protein n=1 Tax=unclassified Pseudomonas TaxID=196821 RepID=UPI000A1DE8FA|nr:MULTISPECIES: ABC transporter ATP-binding protein [unclassified Pseudomonas]